MQSCTARAAVLLIFMLTCVPSRIHAQMMDDDVDDLQAKEVSSTTSRLTWTAVQSVPCEFSITYSVFRSSETQFDPSPDNMIASNLKSTNYLAHDLANGVDTYYHVRAVRHPVYCAPPALTSGRLFVYPLDLGKTYSIKVGDKTEDCQASSPFEIACKTLPYFHAVLAQQAGHEFLIGCLTSDFEDGAWSCVNLTTGAYSVAVHSMTLTFFNAGFSKQSMRTGKTLSPITPVFSVLGTIY